MINADDWGRDAQTTDRTFECFHHGALSSASGMVFMEDSERAAAIAIEHRFDIGLHLKFSAPLPCLNSSSASATPSPEGCGEVSGCVRLLLLAITPGCNSFS